MLRNNAALSRSSPCFQSCTPSKKPINFAELEALVNSQRQQLKPVKDNVALMNLPRRVKSSLPTSSVFWPDGYSRQKITGKHHRMFCSQATVAKTPPTPSSGAACRWGSPTGTIPQNLPKRRRNIVGLEGLVFSGFCDTRAENDQVLSRSPLRRGPIEGRLARQKMPVFTALNRSSRHRVTRNGHILKDQ